MPKRDENYMQAQRDAIARAALGVLIEKGYHETTLRDICRAAGISNGALYSYFPTREAAIVAACAIDHAERLESELPEIWDDYADLPPVEDMAPGKYRSLRFRLSLQFGAEISQMAENPEGLSLIYQVHRDNVRRSLARLKDRGIIAMPYGIEMTTDLHLQLFFGAEYQLGSNRDAPYDQVRTALRKGLAMTAGLVEDRDLP